MDVFAEHGLAADRVILEITESAVIPDPEGAALVLRRLVDLGLEIALDDFGTGWSSMSRLLELPIAALKVDRSFVADLPLTASERVAKGELRARLNAQSIENPRIDLSLVAEMRDPSGRPDMRPGTGLAAEQAPR